MGEVVAGGGEAWIFRVESVAGLSDDSIQDRFRDLRSADYQQLLEIATAPLSGPADWMRLKRKFEEVRNIDFFDAAGRKELETVMNSIEEQFQRPNSRTVAKPNLSGVAGRTWVTRKGVKVDRIACSWLIRRFIDPTPRFLFVDEDRHAPEPGQVRFDMFEGEFTHEGDLCTFEVLLAHQARNDTALEMIAHIVHDLDVKDEKYQRPETSGFATMIAGVIALNSGDEQRIEEGARFLDATYAALKSRAS